MLMPDPGRTMMIFGVARLVGGWRSLYSQAAAGDSRCHCDPARSGHTHIRIWRRRRRHSAPSRTHTHARGTPWCPGWLALDVRTLPGSKIPVRFAGIRRGRTAKQNKMRCSTLLMGRLLVVCGLLALGYVLALTFRFCCGVTHLPTTHTRNTSVSSC